MPIRFECDQCGQRLSIARRKAGMAIDCPTCGVSQRVPGEPSTEGQVEGNSPQIGEDQPEAFLSEPVSAEGAADELMDTEIQENQPPPIIAPTSAGPTPIPDEVDLTKTIDLNLSPPTPPSPAATAPLPPPAPAETDPALAKPRLPTPWSIYAQALLLLAVAVGGFSAGYYLGYQDGSTIKPEPNEQEALASLPDDGFADEEVLLEGHLLWTPSPGQSSGDGSASFIALPQDRIPQASLPIIGLQPGSEHNADTQASIAAIRAIGGVFTRAESDGILAAVIPREGRYYLLMISNNARRSQDRPILAQDLVKMKQYFAEPEVLIGPHKYVWLPAEIRVGTPAVEHDFGLDGL